MTPLPTHPPEFHRFNLQATIRPGMQPTQQQLRSPYYPNPPSMMTPEQQQMYLQQQQQVRDLTMPLKMSLVWSLESVLKVHFLVLLILECVKIGLSMISFTQLRLFQGKALHKL